MPFGADDSRVGFREFPLATWPLPTLLLSPDGEQLLSNAAAERLLTRFGAPTGDIASVLLPDDRQALRDLCSKSSQETEPITAMFLPATSGEPAGRLGIELASLPTGQIVAALRDAGREWELLCTAQCLLEDLAFLTAQGEALLLIRASDGRLRSIFGPTDERLGLPPGDFLPSSSDPRAIADADLPTVTERLAELRAGAATCSVTYRLLGANGRSLPVSARWSAQRDSAGELLRILEIAYPSVKPTPPTQVPTEERFDHLPIIEDPDNLPARLGVTPEMFREIIDLYRIELPNQEAALQAAFDARDYPQMQRIVHKLIGSTANVRASAFGAVGRALEVALQDNELALVPELLRRLRWETGRLMQQLNLLYPST